MEKHGLYLCIKDDAVPLFTAGIHGGMGIASSSSLQWKGEQELDSSPPHPQLGSCRQEGNWSCTWLTALHQSRAAPHCHSAPALHASTKCRNSHSQVLPIALSTCPQVHPKDTQPSPNTAPGMCNGSTKGTQSTSSREQAGALGCPHILLPLLPSARTLQGTSMAPEPSHTALPRACRLHVSGSLGSKSFHVPVMLWHAKKWGRVGVFYREGSKWAGSLFDMGLSTSTSMEPHGCKWKLSIS